MMDFNSTSSVSGQIEWLIDHAMQKRNEATTPRTYLGGSRLGAACERQLQYEYVKAPVDQGKAFSGRILRVFERGHRTEDMVIDWLRLAGFELKTHKNDGHPQGPEANLVVGVICQAIYDCLYASLVEKSRAWNFLQDERLHVWASTVSLDADFIREVASKTGYMSSVPPHKTAKKKKEAQLA